MPTTTATPTTPTTLEQAESHSKMARQAKQMLCGKQGHTLWPAEDDFPLPISSGTVFVHCTRCGVGAAIPLREGQMMTFEEVEGVCATSAAEVMRLCAEGGHKMADGSKKTSVGSKVGDGKIFRATLCLRCHTILQEEEVDGSGVVIQPATVTP